MRPRLLSLTLVFAVLILLSESAYAATFCVTSGFGQGAAVAEMIFSGKITKVQRVETSNVVAGEYVVTFKVDTWWKGKPTHETRVLWRPSMDEECPFLPVGEVGEDYLVYTDPSRNNTARDQLPEVTVLNRTSRLSPNLKFESVGINDWSKQTRISPTPTLNRADGSDDIKLLLVLRECGCLSISHLPPPLDSHRLTSIQANCREAEVVSECQACLRRRLKPF